MGLTAPGPPGSHPTLVRSTGFLLSRLGTVAQRHFSEHLEPLGLTTRLWGALNVLDAEGAITQQALGRRIGVDPSSVVATIDELEKTGLVERRTHPRDRRAHALHLTTEGRETLARARQIARVAQQELLAPLNQEEREQLHELLRRLELATRGEGRPPREGPARGAGP